MTLVTVFGVLVAAFVVAVFALAIWGDGSGSELLDWDPQERIEGRMSAGLDELALGLEEHNRRRALVGLPAQTEDELRRELAHEDDLPGL